MVRVQRHQQLAKGVALGWATLVAQRVPERYFLAVNPLGNGHITPRALKQGTNNRGQQGL